MARYPFSAPRIEVIDPPAGEGFYIIPPARGPFTDAELERLEIHLQKKGDAPMKFTALQYATVAQYTARVSKFAVANQWGEGSFRVLYVRGRTNQSAYSNAVTVKWPVNIPD